MSKLFSCTLVDLEVQVKSTWTPLAAGSLVVVLGKPGPMDRRFLEDGGVRHFTRVPHRWYAWPTFELPIWVRVHVIHPSYPYEAQLRMTDLHAPIRDLELLPCWNTIHEGQRFRERQRKTLERVMKQKILLYIDHPAIEKAALMMMAANVGVTDLRGVTDKSYLHALARTLSVAEGKECIVLLEADGPNHAKDIMELMCDPLLNGVRLMVTDHALAHVYCDQLPRSM